MIRRILLLLAMAVFGGSIYTGLGMVRSHAAEPASRPTATVSRVAVTGTMYLAQGGSLYRLRNGLFTQLHPGLAGQWTQPVVSPDGAHLVAVNRGPGSSDLYLLDLDGHVVRRLTDDVGGKFVLPHWVFYPRFSPDGGTLYYSFDAPKYADDYRVDLAVWSMPINSGQKSARRQSTFNDYSGGDTYPIPLAPTGLLYAKYANDEKGPFSQLWYQARSLSPGVGLTTPDDDCGQPALSPAGTEVALVCTGRSQVAQLRVASIDAAGALGPLRTLVDGTLAAVPAWAPDGSSIAYLAPAGSRSHFELWKVAVPAEGAPATPPKQLTQGLDFDATSAPAWIATR
ncbi:MAG: TolB family protein [Candidatus Dormibacteria bacterium]